LVNLAASGTTISDSPEIVSLVHQQTLTSALVDDAPVRRKPTTEELHGSRCTQAWTRAPARRLVLEAGVCSSACERTDEGQHVVAVDQVCCRPAPPSAPGNPGPPTMDAHLAPLMRRFVGLVETQSSRFDEETP